MAVVLAKYYHRYFGDNSTSAKVQDTKQVSTNKGQRSSILFEEYLTYVDLAKKYIQKGRECAKKLKREMVVMQLAITDSRCPRSAKIIAGLSIAYALSPIDLIPDCIPVLGYVDDLIIVPAGLALALKLIPKEVMDDARKKTNSDNKLPKNKYVGAAVIGTWTLCGGYMAYKVGKLCSIV